MLLRCSWVLPIWIAVGLLSLGFAPQNLGVHRAHPLAERFPRGTVLVVRDTAHARTYFATEPGVQSMLFSADGKRLIVRCIYDSYVLDAGTLRVLRHLRGSKAWWEGSRLGYLDLYKSSIHTRGHKLSATMGRVQIIGADPSGRFFLAARQISRGTSENGNRPTYRLQIWQNTKRGRLKFARHLTTETYDPTSQEDPYRLLVLNRSTLVFGVDGGGADGEDFVGVMQGRRVTAPLKDRRGRPLRFAGQSPILAGNAIVGLAEAVDFPRRQNVARYLFRVTAARITLQPVSSNVLFVTYDAKRRAIGLGISDKHGVTIRYNGISRLV